MAAASYLSGSMMGAVQERAAAATSQKIDWTILNWPCRNETFGILHLDLNELEQKRGAETALAVKVAYYWWLLMLATTIINFLDSCVLAGTLRDSQVFPGVNVFLSFLNILIAAIGGTAAWYYVHVGLADYSGRDRMFGNALVGLFVVLALIFAFASFGSTNGFARFGQEDGFKAAKAAGLRGVGYWKVAIVVESLLWLFVAFAGGWSLFRARQAAMARR